MAIIKPGEAGTLESMALPINITKIVEYDSQSRYLILAKMENANALSAEQQNRLTDQLTELMAPSEIAVVFCDADFDLEFYQIGGESS